MMAGMKDVVVDDSAPDDSESGSELGADTTYQQNVAAIKAAIRDTHNGDTGRPAHLVIEELRTELAAH
jgi:hypothetical protein